MIKMKGHKSRKGDIRIKMRQNRGKKSVEDGGGGEEEEEKEGNPEKRNEKSEKK